MSFELTPSEVRQEKEANYFARALLMPADLFMTELRSATDQGLFGDKLLRHMSKKFQVEMLRIAERMEDMRKLGKLEFIS